MANYFSKFQPILYNPNFKVANTSYQLVTNIFFRARFKEIIKNENVPYYLYTVRDHDLPETLANKYYGSPEAHWIILLANDMVNPYYDWPLSESKFNSYIREKYGSLEYAKTTIHSYKKIVRTTDSSTGLQTDREFEIDFEDARTANTQTFPYDDYDSLAVDYFPNVPGNFDDGSAVTLVISRDEITIYDWEHERNESKRNIKLIRKEYYESIQKQLATLVRGRPIFSRDIGSY